MEMLTVTADGRNTNPASDLSGYEGRMCVICSGEMHNSYRVFILDFDGAGNGNDEFMKKSPTLCFEGLGRMCFCVVDSFLYMFDSRRNIDERSGKLWMYKYDLRPHLSKSDFVVNCWDMLKESRGPDIHYPKWHPRAIQIPNSKSLLLYSQLIRCCTFEGEERTKPNDIDFELFDPSIGIWAALPQLHVIPPFCDYHSSFSFSLRDLQSGKWISHEIDDCSFDAVEIGSLYIANRGLVRLEVGTFINNNTFLVCIPPGMLFTLNIDSPGEGWKVYQDYIRPRWDGLVWDGNHVVDQLLLSPFMVRNKAGYRPFTLSKYIPNIPDFYEISILDYVPNQECVTCIVSAGVNEAIGRPYLMCDLFKLDLPPTNDDQTEPKPPTRLASFKYDLSYGRRPSYFDVEYLCPMAIIEAPAEG